MQLKDCSEQQRYRARCDNDTEAVSFVPAAAQGCVWPSRLKLVSLRSKQVAKIRFHNLFKGQVRALWMDFDGHEVAYSILSPGERKLYLTYNNHCWIFRELSTGRRMNIDNSQAVFANKDTVPTVSIRAPPVLVWQERCHLGFPNAYTSAVQTLLCCHNSLAKQLHASLGHTSPANNDTTRLNKRCRTCQCDNTKTCCCISLAYGKHIRMDVSDSSCTQEQQANPSEGLNTMHTATLGCLPLHILKEIIRISAPTDIWQDACCSSGCPDILPFIASVELLKKDV